MNGTLAAKEKVELISHDGNIVLSGSITGRDSSGLKNLSMTASGTTPITEYVLDANSGLLKYEDAQHHAYLKDAINNKYYLWQDLTTGRYAFSAAYADDANGTLTVQTFYSTTPDPRSGTLYFSDNSTAVSDTSKVYDLEAKYTEITSTSVINSLTPVTTTSSPGNIILRNGSTTPGSIGTLVTATDLVQLHAQNALIGQGLAIDVTGAAGVVDVSVGTNLTLDGSTTIRADGEVALASTGGDLIINGNIRGHSTTPTDKVVLSSFRDMTITSTILATNLISLHAGRALTAGLSLTASGASGAIDVYSGNSLNVGTSVLNATKSITLGSGSDLTLNSTSLTAPGGGTLATVSLTAGRDLTVSGAAVSATDLIHLDATRTLSANANLTASGATGTIEVHSGATLNLSSATLRATDRIDVSSDNDLTLTNGSVKGVGSGTLREVVLHSGHNLSITGGAVAATDLIDLRRHERDHRRPRPDGVRHPGHHQTQCRQFAEPRRLHPDGDEAHRGDLGHRPDRR